ACRRGADFISFQIPLPHFEISGLCSEVESLLSSFPYARQAYSEGREHQKRSGIHQPDNGDPTHWKCDGCLLTPYTSDFRGRSFRKNEALPSEFFPNRDGHA